MSTAITLETTAATKSWQETKPSRSASLSQSQSQRKRKERSSKERERFVQQAPLNVSRRNSETRSEPTLTSKDVAQQLIADHQADIWRYLRALGCSCDLADDLTQETFLVALRRPFNYLGPKAALGYLRRSAYHRFLSHLQQNQKCNASELTAVAVNEETWVRWCGKQRSSHSIIGALQSCFDGLPERDRFALLLRYRDDLSRKEIANKLGMGEHGAKNLIQRAKKRLRAAMESQLTQGAAPDMAARKSTKKAMTTSRIQDSAQ